MHADDALRTLGRLGDLVDRDRRRVRGKNRVRRHDALELREGLALRLELLDDRLDHEVAVGEIREVRREGQPPKRGVPLLCRQLLLLDRTPEVVLDRPARALAELLAHLSADRLEPRLRGDLGDARAHRPQPDHSHPANHERDANWKKPTLSCV